MVRNSKIKNHYLIHKIKWAGLFLAIWMTATGFSGDDSSDIGLSNDVDNTHKRKEELLPYKGISIEAPVQFEFRQSDTKTAYAEIEGEKKLTDLIDFSYSYGQLVIKFRGGNPVIRKKDRPKITVFASTLSFLVMNETADATIKDLSVSVFSAQQNSSGNIFISGLKVDSLDASVSSTGNVEIEWIEAKFILAANTGKGAIRLIGTTQEINLLVTGKGPVNASEMTANKVIAISKGMGNIYCHAVVSLDATTTSGGDIVYTGHPEVKKDRQSSGRIRRER